MITFAAIAAAAILHPVHAPKLIQSSVIPKESKAAHDARMHWWRNARFGMFIHWGLYAIPAGKWGDKTNYAEWIREEAHIPVHEYEKLQPKFNPVKFNPDLWAAMAKDAGMKYVVLTTKHHDGFNMFHSKYTDWSVEHTPYKKDVAAMLANSVRKKGLQMGFYHSIMDWHHPDYLPRRGWEVADRPADGANFDRFNQYLRNDVKQILTEYGKIGVLWFDGEWENTWNANLGDSLYAFCRQVNPTVIVNNRVSVGRAGIEDARLMAGDYGTPEQTIPATGLPGQDWETCMTMNDHWGYNAADTHWKSTTVLLHNLIDIASKGGNYLLNIGPRADGTFPPEAVERLHDMGQWMHVNGDSIYGTTASVFEKLPWGRSTTKLMRGKTRLYLQVFDWPKDGKLVVPGLGNRPLSARVLGGSECSVVKGDGSVTVTVPAKPVNSIATVVALDVVGAPIVYKAPAITADTSLVYGGVPVTMSGPSASLQIRYTSDGSVPRASSPVYTHTIYVSAPCTLSCATFNGATRVSSVTSMVFHPANPMPAATVTALIGGANLSTYKGTWDKLPDFVNLTPESTTTTSTIKNPMDGKKAMENVGELYTGYIRIQKDGVYVFALSSDDGSRLMIDDKLIVDNDGPHGVIRKTGEVALAVGPHKFALAYFNGTGDAGLDLKMKRVGSAGWKTVGQNDLFHE